MKNVITYYFEKQQQDICDFLQYQMEIGLALGWDPRDILIVSNRKIKYKNVKSIIVKFPKHEWSKYIYRTYSFLHLFKELKINDIIWYHDWDTIQMEPLDYILPEDKDLAAYYGYYYQRKKQPNGGSMFIRPSFIDILEKWQTEHLKTKHDTTEPSLQVVIKDQLHRIEHLPAEYNIGEYSFGHRMKEAKKPIKAFHFKITRPKYVKKFLPRIIKQATKYENTAKVLEILIKYLKKWKHKHPEIEQIFK